MARRGDVELLLVGSGVVEHGVDRGAAHLVAPDPRPVHPLFGRRPDADVASDGAVRHLDDDREGVERLEEVARVGIAQGVRVRAEAEGAAEPEEVEEEGVGPETGVELAAAGDLDRVAGRAAGHDRAVSAESDGLLRAGPGARASEAGHVVDIGDVVARVVDVERVPDVRPERERPEEAGRRADGHGKDGLAGVRAVEDVDVVDVPVALERTGTQRPEARGVEMVGGVREERRRADGQDQQRRSDRSDRAFAPHGSIDPFWIKVGDGLPASSTGASCGLDLRASRLDPSIVREGMRRTGTFG